MLINLNNPTHSLAQYLGAIEDWRLSQGVAVQKQRDTAS